MTMQLKITNLAQVPPINSTSASLKLSFTISGDLPSFVQIYAAPSGGGVGSAQLVEIVPTKSGMYQYNDIPFSLKPGVYYTVYVCPRTGSESQPDDTIDGVYWENYCAAAYIATKTQASPPAPLVPPVINSLVPHPANMNQPNRITLMWSSSTSYDKYVLGWLDWGYQSSPQTINYNALLQNPPWDPNLNVPHGSIDINQKGTSGSWDLQTQPNHLYFFHVNGGRSQFWNYLYSAWGSTTAQVAIPNRTSLRLYLLDSGIDPAGQSVRSLLSSGQTVRNFMQI